MIIKTKKDFKPFCLEITPKLTVKKYVEICNKFKAMDFWYEPRNGLKELERKIGQCYLYINTTGHIFSDYKLDKEGLKPLEIISVEDFLREEDYPIISSHEEKYDGIFYKDKRYDATPKGIQQLVDDFSKNNQYVIFPKEDERIYKTKNKKSFLPFPRNIAEGETDFDITRYNRFMIQQICESLREKEQDDKKKELKNFNNLFEGLSYCYKNSTKKIKTFNTEDKSYYLIQYHKELQKFFFSFEMKTREISSGTRVFTESSNFKRKWKILNDFDFVINCIETEIIDDKEVRND